MSRAVLDSSAVLALLHHEPGEEVVWPLVPDAVMSAVNAAEVQAKLIADGLTPLDAWDAVLGSVRQIIPFGEEQAEATGNLSSSTRRLGLSLGDRACLSLGSILGLPVYTADRSWTKLKIGIDVRVVR